MDFHIHCMGEAMQQAEAAYAEKEVPVGAVITVGNRIIARGYNRTEGLQDPTAHAEIIALTAAAEHLNSWRMEGAEIYVTLEPCVMCVGAILNARIGTVYYGAKDPRFGSCGSRYDLLTDNPYIRNARALSGLYAEESLALMKRFFQELRDKVRPSDDSRRDARAVDWDGLENR